MARPAVLSIEDKFRLVLAVVAGEMTIAEAARRSKVSEQSIGNWKRQFLEGGKQGLAEGGRPGSNPQLQRLEAEVEELKAALGEAHVELRVWKKSAEGRLGPTRSSR
jgi:transposase